MSVEVDMGALNARLKKMRERASNPSPVMQYISTMMYKDIMDHFD